MICKWFAFPLSLSLWRVCRCGPVKLTAASAIVDLLLPQSRIVNIKAASDITAVGPWILKAGVNQPFPITLHIDSYWRAIALRDYALSFTMHLENEPMCFNPKTDLLYMENQNVLEALVAEVRDPVQIVQLAQVRHAKLGGCLTFSLLNAQRLFALSPARQSRYDSLAEKIMMVLSLIFIQIFPGLKHLELDLSRLDVKDKGDFVSIIEDEYARTGPAPRITWADGTGRRVNSMQSCDALDADNGC